MLEEGGMLATLEIVIRCETTKHMPPAKETQRSVNRCHIQPKRAMIHVQKEVACTKWHKDAAADWTI
jgi:hypothetical protein